MPFANWIRVGAIALVGMVATACASYPEAPRYSTRPMPTYGGTAAPVSPPVYAPPVYEAPPPMTAPVARIEGGALPPPGGAYAPPPPAYTPAPAYAPPPASTAPMTVTAGAAYVIQPGDTISGVGRRFQTPVQNLIDLNGLGPRGAISIGQSVILPDSAVDTGPDPYATGPAPVGVMVPENGVIPPPPPPPSGNAALPPPPREPAVSGAVGTVVPGATGLQWPVRGDILRRFGPVGLGERNNGINIGAAAGAAVNAAAPGRVAYVGDDLVGQGLTVLIVHRDGWRTVYGHLGSATVDDGADVRAGQQIGTVGLTAGDGRPSIHFETRRMQGDEPVAIDPLTVLPR
ncbi:peptidoglycan DD-metalloendopeptidase family protein [Brevundimonas sp. R86498]|uniref:peptidoglycan DD-metalloendopeptidase family protein n=1 Tax=Brevundimonas sp. R86498 TaxID=3093845 RepID=UPI0037CAF509